MAGGKATNHLSELRFVRARDRWIVSWWSKEQHDEEAHISRQFAAFRREAENPCGNQWLPQGNWYTVQCTVYTDGDACYKGATVWAASPRDAAVRVTSLLGEVYADEDGWAYDGPADDDFVVARARLATVAEVAAQERRLQARLVAEEATRDEEIPF